MAWLHQELASPAPAPPPGVVRQGSGWFLAGTEPPAPPSLAGGGARIVAPAPGTIVALDPDIPPARQRIVFEAEVHGTALRWLLDGEDHGSAGDLLVWPPTPGRHAVLLVNAAGETLDALTFEVRGAAAAMP
jgi:penicillin-binding protein 1C